MSKYDVIVIGAGHNGLVTATRLAKRGKKVLVLEQRPHPGGLAASEPFAQGFRGAPILNDHARVSPEMVAALALEQHGLCFQDSDQTLLASPERGLLLSADNAATAGEIAVCSPKDGDQYRAWCTFLDRIRPIMGNLFSGVPSKVEGLAMRDLMGLLKKGMNLRKLGKADMLEILRINLMCTADWLNEWFETDLLKAGLALPAHRASFTGPWSPGTVINLLQHQCTRGRAVKGGAPALVDALTKAAAAAGVEIRTGTRVTDIQLDRNGVSGVQLEDKTQLETSLVAAACHPSHTLLDLIAPAHLPHKLEREIQLYRTRGTTAIVHLALSKPLRYACRSDLDVARARLVSTLDNMERAFDPVKYGRFPETPVLEVYRPTCDDPKAAPPGKDVASIEVHFVPYRHAENWSEQTRGRLLETVIATLAKHAPGVAETVEASELLTPVDLEARYGLSGGHIYQGEQALDQIMIRPTMSCGDYATPIKGLFLCGAGTRPGGGLSGLPGLYAADKILG